MMKISNVILSACFVGAFGCAFQSYAQDEVVKYEPLRSVFPTGDLSIQCDDVLWHLDWNTTDERVGGSLSLEYNNSTTEIDGFGASVLSQYQTMRLPHGKCISAEFSREMHEPMASFYIVGSNVEERSWIGHAVEVDAAGGYKVSAASGVIEHPDMNASFISGDMLIQCANMFWDVNWKEDAGNLRGELYFRVNDLEFEITDFEISALSKFKTIEPPSAICNPVDDRGSNVNLDDFSQLFINGYDQNGVQLLYTVSAGSDGQYEIQEY